MPSPNPIVTHACYADPEPHVWADGKIYIYCSHDESRAVWCSDNYHVVYSADMVHWVDAGVSFTMKDMPSDSGKLLWACDVAFKDGTYYLYASTDDGTLAVATSRSPTGPFGDAKKVGGLPDKPGIDPAVFIDDDGQAYLYWGQTDNVRAAKLKPNMLEVDATTIMQPLTRAGHFFHEGSALIKRNGVYYLVYADESRNIRPTCVGYATGPTPFGPFTYRGVIIDNIGCDPAVWNNHGRIVEFKGQWYVFHHRSIEGDQRPRQMCVEPITFNADGSIPEVRMTTRGAGEPLDATHETPSHLACRLSGSVRVERDRTNYWLGQFQNGDVATFAGMTIPPEAAGETFVARAAIAHGEATLECRLDDPASEPIAVIAMKAAGGWETFTGSITRPLPRDGSHDLLLSIRGKGTMSLAWFKVV